MSRKGERRLILPWEEEQQRMPKPVKAIFILLTVVVFVAFFVQECTVPEAHAQSPCDRLGAPEAMHCRRMYEAKDRSLRDREVKALESIAGSLRRIERELRK